MTKRKNTRSALASLLLGFAGQANTLVIPRPFISLCHGDHLAALLLSQILYWQDRTDDPNGWFSKSYEDWDEELGLTETQVKRLIRGDKRTKTPMFKLEDIGVETKLSRAKAYNGAATMHYRVNLEVFEALVLSNARNPALSGNDDLSNAENDDPSNARNVITETTTETTNKESVASDDAVVSDASPKPKRKSTPNPIFDAVALLFFDIADTAQLNGKAARIGKIVSWLKDNSPGATPDTLKAFALWYDKETNGIPRPRDVEKFKERFVEFRQQALARKSSDPTALSFNHVDRAAAEQDVADSWLKQRMAKTEGNGNGRST